MNFIMNSLKIRRPEFIISELPIIAIPFFLTMTHYSQFYQLMVLEGFMLFFLYFHYGDMINCLIDREVDAKSYKNYLSKAIDELGVKCVMWQIALSGLLATVIAAHLAWSLDRWSILWVHLVALFFGGQYTAPPLELKSRGLWQIPCYMAILFFLPMIYIALIFESSPHWLLYVIFFGFSSMQTATILVNTAEDYEEDKGSNIYTCAIALGIPNTMLVANIMFFIGTTVMLAAFAILFYQNSVSYLAYSILLITSISWLIIQYDLWKLYRGVKSGSFNEAVLLVKKKAKLLPIWLSVMAWASCFCALTILLSYSQ